MSRSATAGSIVHASTFVAPVDCTNDANCSTGNLLFHIKRAFPEMTLTGGELAESSLTAARGNLDLAGIDFRTMDMLDIPGQYDCITANAVTVLPDPDSPTTATVSPVSRAFTWNATPVGD